MRTRSPRFWVLFGIGMATLFGAVMFVTFVVLDPPPGQAVASTPVVSGQPFSVTWTSDGRPLRAWIDVHTSLSGFPMRGSARVSSAGALLATEPMEVSADGGFAVSHTSIGDDETLEAYLLFDLPAGPAAAPMRIDGILELHPQTVVTSTDPSRNRAIPPPHTLRFWVAP